MRLILQSAVSGLLVGGMYGLIALGLALAFGVLKVLNVAHGELVMLGGYGTVRAEPFNTRLHALPPAAALAATSAAMRKAFALLQ